MTQPEPQITRYQRWLEQTTGRRFDTYEALWRWSVTDLRRLCGSIWRDFALHAYISAVELPRAAALDDDDTTTAALPLHERDLARTITTATEIQLKHADWLILSNLHPTKLHETVALTQTVTQRTARHRAIIALTAHDPWSLSEAFDRADPTHTTWQHFYTAMRESSYIAH